MKVIYLGTPDFAVLPLKKIIESGFEVVAVVSQPDRPVGRKREIKPTPVKACALEYGIPVYQFEKIRNEYKVLKELNADIMVTCAYGQILTQEVIDLTPKGVFNIHASLLPKYRGASPVQSVLLGMEKETGVSILRSGIGLDDGDVMMVKKIDIAEEDNAITLFDKLSRLSAEVIIPALDSIEDGTAVFRHQDESLATKCSMLKPEMGNVDFTKSPEEVVGLIKGLAQWPNVRITIDDVYFKLFNAVVSKVDVAGFDCGQVVVANNKQGLHIKCGNGAIEITEILPINSKRMSAKSYLNGKQIKVGSIAR